MTHVKLSIEIMKEGQLFLSSERILFLKSISEAGSLLAAAKQLGMSYNKAWNLLETINKGIGVVVAKNRGGKGGGGAQLTNYGKRVLADYYLIENQVEKFEQQLNVEINL